MNFFTPFHRWDICTYHATETVLITALNELLVWTLLLLCVWPLRHVALMSSPLFLKLPWPSWKHLAFLTFESPLCCPSNLLCLLAHLVEKLLNTQPLVPPASILPLLDWQQSYGFSFHPYTGCSLMFISASDSSPNFWTLLAISTQM